mgnify:CR=1 FL=1
MYDAGEDLASLQPLSAAKLTAQLGCSSKAYTKQHPQPSSVAEISLDALPCMCAVHGRECRCMESTTSLPAPLVQQACK